MLHRSLRSLTGGSARSPEPGRPPAGTSRRKDGVTRTMQPQLSEHFASRQPSDIRIAGIRFARRTDGARAVNVAIGNVSLPMHPAMTARMKTLGEPGTPFAGGVVGYTGTVGTDECRKAFLNVIASSGFPTEGLHCQVTDGGSQAMELVLLGTCGPAGTAERPLLLIDAAYTNYKAFANRLGRGTVSIMRHLNPDGHYSLPSIEDIEAVIREKKPGALLVIPYDNPTGHFYDHETLVALGRLCVAHGLWMVSDEAYRELNYTGQPSSSVWRLTEEEVPGICGRRISIETASKVWNACGLRIGALVTDNEAFHTQAVAENTAGLCSNAIGQHIFGALAHESAEALQEWYGHQRGYYRSMLEAFTEKTRALLPGAIVSSPDASIYSVVDLRDIVGPDFDSLEFVLFCASEGVVEAEDGRWTLLVAPMKGFYDCPRGTENPGRTQMRVAFVETPERMERVPVLLAALVEQYRAKRPAPAAVGTPA